MTDRSRTVSCSRCGESVTCAEDSIPPGWTILTEDRRVSYVCVACARENLRSIEAKLPEEYW